MYSKFLLFYVVFCGLPARVPSFRLYQTRHLTKRGKTTNKLTPFFKGNPFYLCAKKEETIFKEDKNCIRIEFRPGVGGEEAVSWSDRLLNTYKTFAEKKGCIVEKVKDVSDSLIVRSCRNITINKDGKEIETSLYDLFKDECGIHQVKRIPKNEAKGRIHSSTATIAIFMHTNEEIGQESIDPKDLKVTTFRSSKPGGQNVNKIESGVTILYLPMGIKTTCQEERTQELNKRKAMKRLILKITEIRNSARENKLQRERSKQVQQSNRSNRIRTYNFFRRYITDYVTNRKINLDHFEKAKLENIFNI
ncbi:peptide chain release factor 1, putative [Plasmodium ovale]|uniref:Peptide chain release factor 1, putative n=1 Tax=Plasmodium ovale TaxID=36330 RepID=A0A1D3TMH6_PLAOA|nr:peptide chain release factor 1, putative [Plasmodium ovale]